MTEKNITPEESKFTPKEIEALIAKADEWELHGRSILHQYSIRTMVKEFNGVGPDRMNPFWRWFLTKLSQRYLPAVLIHDMEYTTGGDEEAFHRSNLNLKTNLRIILNKLFHKWNPWYWVEYAAIWIIYRACEYYGPEGFHRHHGVIPV